MILVRKRYLFILTLLFCVILVFGEVKFFMALKSIQTHINMELKYELENFIFAFIVLLLIVFLFYINFIRLNSNILKRLDKMIEISEYGKHDIGPHLEAMGELGKKVNYLIFHFKNLNKMRALKISSLSKINNFLLEKIPEELFLMDFHGNILDFTSSFAEEIQISKDQLKDRNITDFLKKTEFENIRSMLEKKRSPIEKGDISLGKNGKLHKITFSPIMNSENQVAYIVGIIGNKKRIGLFK